jgi:hypothetical protein
LYLYIFIKDYLNKKKGLILRHFFYLSLAVVGSLFLSAVLLLPSIELFKTSMMGKPVDFPYPPKHLITLIWPFFFGSPKTGNYPLYNNNWGIFWENTGYVGLLPLITFFISFFLIKNKKIIIFLILIFLSIILVLGKYSPIYFIFDLPPLRYFRVASRFLLITDLSLALLTGLVFTELFNHKVLKNKMSWLVFISLLLLQVTNIFYYFYNYHPVGDAKLWLSEPEIVKYLKKDRSQYRIYTIEDNDKWNDIFLNNGWENPEKYLVFKNGLFIHSNFLYDVPKNNIYSRFIRPRVQFFNGLIDEENFSTLSAELLGMKSVKYVITSKNKKLEGIKFLKYFRNYSLYLNPYFKERIAVVYQYKTVETTNQYKNYLLSDEFEPDRQAIVEDDLKINPQCLKTNSCNYRIDKIIDQDSIVKFSVETNDKGILILRDTYDDNWKAEVDGLSVKIFPVNLTQRGILITAGVHQVQFSYKPSSYRIGLIISIVSHILLTIFFLFYLSRLRGTSSL